MALFRTHCWLWREFIEMKAIKLITRICNINNFKVKAACNHTYNFARPKSHTSYVTVPSKRLSLALKPWQTFSSLLIDVLSMILFLETQWFLLIMMHLILRSSSCSCVGAGLPCSGQYQMQSNLFEATLWPMDAIQMQSNLFEATLWPMDTISAFFSLNLALSSANSVSWSIIWVAVKMNWRYLNKKQLNCNPQLFRLWQYSLPNISFACCSLRFSSHQHSSYNRLAWTSNLSSRLARSATSCMVWNVDNWPLAHSSSCVTL